MNTTQADQLEDKAWKGPLAPADVQRLAELLDDPRCSRKLVTLLKAAGLGRALTLQSRVERFLSPSYSPTVFAMALGTLTAYWGMEREYRDIILAAVRGYSWDVDRDVQRRGLIAAGNLLAKQPDPELLEAVIHVTELQETNAEEDIPIPGTKRLALQTLDRVVTPGWHELSHLQRHQTLGEAEASSVLDRAKRLLAEQGWNHGVLKKG